MTGILNVLLAGSAPSGPVLYDGIVATRGVSPQQLVGAFTNASTRSGYLARTDIAALSIICPNYSGSEAAPGATASITASVEYPPGVMTGQQIKFSGSATGTIPNGGMLRSDTLTLPQTIKNGDMFWIRTFRSCSAGLVSNNEVAGAYVDQFFMGDRWETTATDKTMSGDIDEAEDNASYHPVVIAPTTAPSILILGDSIVLGVTDDVTYQPIDISGDRGAIARSTGPKFGYFNGGFPGEAATTFISSHTQRLTLLPYCTHVIFNYGTNDVFAGDSKATIEGNLTTIYGLCTGKTVFQATLVPRTTSSDWSDAAGQTVLAGEGVRTALNDDLRAGTFKPAGGVFNITAPVETSLNSGKWTFPGKTVDGIHPANPGYLDIKASGAIDTSLIGTPAPVSETGSGWGDKGTLITLSSLKRSNDTAQQVTAVGNTTARGAQGRSAGLLVFEVEILGPENSGFLVGLLTGTTATGSGLDSLLSSIDDSFGIFQEGSAYSFGGIFTVTGAAGTIPHDNRDHLSVWRIFVDFTHGFAYAARNNDLLFGAVPTSGAAGTGHVAAWTPGPTLYPGISLATNSISPVRLRTNILLYPLIGSYTAWG